MRLIEAIQNIQHDSTWGIWAETPFAPDSEAHYGQRQFENGGLLDDKEFFDDGLACGDFLASYCEGEDMHECLSEFGQEAAAQMIIVVEVARKLLK